MNNAEVLVREWARAVAERDVAWLDSFLAPEFALVTGRPGAETRSRDEYLAITAERYVVRSYGFDELEVVDLGDMAVVRSRYRQAGSMDGADRTQAFRMTDVLVRRDGVWQAVTRHITAIPDP